MIVDKKIDDVNDDDDHDVTDVDDDCYDGNDVDYIDYCFSSYSSSSYTLLLCMPLSTYHYFSPHLTITPSFLLIYFSVYYFLQDGWTPLHIAGYNGLESTVLVLLQNGADLNLQDEVTSRRMMKMIEDDDDDDNNCGDDDRCC